MNTVRDTTFGTKHKRLAFFTGLSVKKLISANSNGLWMLFTGLMSTGFTVHELQPSRVINSYEQKPAQLS
jgi:hypothetical protein